jgi:predicted aspartyl protease
MAIIQTRKSFRLKFSFAKRRLIILPVYLNGKGPFGFILDTGAGRTTLSKHAAKRLKLKTLPTKSMALGAGGRVKMESTTINCLQMGGINCINHKIFVIDKFLISKALKRQIFGVIGYDLLSRYIITIYYKKKTIIFKKTT